MIATDTELEIKKFKMYAEKADSDKKIMDLCKKYLAHKGIDIDKMLDMNAVNASMPKEVQNVYVGPGTCTTYRRMMIIDNNELTLQNTVAHMADLRHEAAKKILYDLIKDGFLHSKHKKT